MGARARRAKVGDEAGGASGWRRCRREAAGRAQGAALGEHVRDAQAAAVRRRRAARAAQAARAVEQAVAALSGADGAAEAERLGERLRSAGEE